MTIVNKFIEKLVNENQIKNLSLFGRLFGLISSVFYIFQISEWSFLYGSESAIPINYVIQYYNLKLQPLFYTFPADQFMTKFWYAVMIQILFLSAFIKVPVFLKIAAWYLHIMFFYRNIPMALAEDYVINTFFIFYIFSDISSLIIKKYLIIGLRVQILVIYFVSGFSKLLGSQWRNGKAMGHIMSSDISNLFTSHFLLDYIFISALVGWGVILFELSAPIGFSLIRTKKYWMVFGLIFHTIASIYLGVWFFSILMLVAYTVFCDIELTVKFKSKIKALGKV